MTFLAPEYGGATLSDVLPAVAHALGLEAGLGSPALSLPPAPSYVVMLVDGMGLVQLREHRAHVPFLSSLTAVSPDATAGVPSTTATSLTSLGTGLPPGSHGVVGFTSRIPGSNDLLNALFWSNEVDPLEWQPEPTALERIGRAGAFVTAVSKREYRTSGLTRAGLRGAEYAGADSVGERIAAASRAAGQQPSLTYVYDSELDFTGHRHGVDSAEWRNQLRMVDASVEQLHEALPSRTRLLVVADHGMVDATDRVDLDTLPGLRDGVVLLGGEARFRHVYVALGALDDVVATWREVLGERAVVLTREEAVARGWFGEVSDRIAPRIGDVVAAATGRTALFSSRDFDYEMRLVGVHGSLTPDEMRIPLLLA